MIDLNKGSVNYCHRVMQFPGCYRMALVVIMIVSISMPAIVVADDQTLPANSATGNAVSESESAPPADSVKNGDVQSETLPEGEDKVEPTDESSETVQSPPVPNNPANDIPEVEDEVDPTDDQVETAPLPAVPDAPGSEVPQSNDGSDSFNGTEERAPPEEVTEPTDESNPMVEEMDKATVESTEESVATEPATSEPTEPQTLEVTTEPTEPSTPESTETTAPPADIDLEESSKQSGTPEPTETPTPTAAPAIPFEPNMTCVQSPGSAVPAVGDSEWSYLDCTAKWKTKEVSSATLLPVQAPAGWEIVPLNERTNQDPNQMILNPTPLQLLDEQPDDDAFAESKFHLATRVSCVDVTAVTVPLQFRAISGEDALQETATVNHQINASAASLPEVELTSAIFEDASPPDGTTTSTGVITMNYSNATESCGWKITTVVDDFVAPDGELPASDLSLIEVVGPTGLTSSIENGEITVVAAPGVAMPASGFITINVSMPVPETASSGVYSTTITADAGAP